MAPIRPGPLMSNSRHTPVVVLYSQVSLYQICIESHIPPEMIIPSSYAVAACARRGPGIEDEDDEEEEEEEEDDDDELLALALLLIFTHIPNAVYCHREFTAVMLLVPYSPCAPPNTYQLAAPFAFVTCTEEAYATGVGSR